MIQGGDPLENGLGGTSAWGDKMDEEFSDDEDVHDEAEDE